MEVITEANEYEYLMKVLFKSFLMVCSTLLCYLSHMTIFQSADDLLLTLCSFQDGLSHSVSDQNTSEFARSFIIRPTTNPKTPGTLYLISVNQWLLKYQYLYCRNAQNAIFKLGWVHG